jgi:hypothetical protein
MSNRSLQQNSLLTGKLTGKISKWALKRQSDHHFMLQLRWFLAKFPVKTNRELFRQNRETKTR